MDRTLANIASILLGGAGIFTVLTGFNVPELNQTFLETNPFAVKRDIIQDVLTWVFTGVALLGLGVQLVAEIAGDRVPDRLHSVRTYVKAAGAGLFAVVALVWGLTVVGHSIARALWTPEVIALQREAFMHAAFIVEHDGWRQDQLRSRSSVANPDWYRNANFEQSERIIAQIEKLLEVAQRGDTLRDRVNALKPSFGQ